MVVGRRELREKTVGLFEVVAENLLELDLAVAVHPVGPLHEPLVQ